MLRTTSRIALVALTLFACGGDDAADDDGTHAPPPARSTINPATNLRPIYRLPGLGSLKVDNIDSDSDLDHIRTHDISVDASGTVYWGLAITRFVGDVGTLKTAYGFTVGVDGTTGAVRQEPTRETIDAATIFVPGTSRRESIKYGTENEFWYDGSHGIFFDTIGPTADLVTRDALGLGPDDKVTGEWKQPFRWTGDDPWQLRGAAIIPIDSAGHMGLLYGDATTLKLEGLDHALKVETPYTPWSVEPTRYTVRARQTRDGAKVVVSLRAIARGLKPSFFTTVIYDKAAKTLTKVLDNASITADLGVGTDGIDCDEDGNMIFIASATEDGAAKDIHKLTPAGDTVLAADFLRGNEILFLRAFDRRIFLTSSYELVEVPN